MSEVLKFRNASDEGVIVILTVGDDGAIWLNPDVKPEDAARELLAALTTQVAGSLVAEREACAKIAESWSNVESGEPTAWAIAKAIRARKDA